MNAAWGILRSVWQKRAAPVAVIVTSGTAVANLYPALIEASLTGEKLIFLTADRPPELIDCGANQAIRQPGIFASHPAQSLALPRPSQDIPARWLLSAVDHLMASAQTARCTSTARLPNRCTVKWMIRGLPGSSARRLVAGRQTLAA
jgi:2-succinyl-5-enolpyruvyl-6-hydroxy-3-cyclohexene-1-carboxylate synthase